MTDTQLPDKARHVRRHSNYDAVKDDFPTPPWAVRAFFKHVVPGLRGRRLIVSEPAAGRGHMVRVLKEQKFKVLAADLVDYGVGFKTADYLTAAPQPCDVVLTNPPYRHANTFAHKRVLSSSATPMRASLSALPAEQRHQCCGNLGGWSAIDEWTALTYHHGLTPDQRGHRWQWH